MILSKTTEYAVRILSFMAKNNTELNSAKYLHNKLNIPYKYLTRLMTDLVKNNYLISIKGRNGGFKINKELSKITLANIIESVEGMDSFNSCVLGFHECSDENPCAMHFIWEENKHNFVHTLEKTTLLDLCKTNIAKY